MRAVRLILAFALVAQLSGCAALVNFAIDRAANAVFNLATGEN
jgi:hypothetical protein